MRNVLKNNPQISAERLARTRTLMNEAVRDCLVSGYEDRMSSLELPDPDDCHVLAAAVHGDAQVIVTYNLKDFPAEALAPFGIEALHPDDFIVALFDFAPGPVCEALRRQREGLRNPPRTADQFLETLDSQGLTRAVARMREFVDLL